MQTGQEGFSSPLVSDPTDPHAVAMPLHEAIRAHQISVDGVAVETAENGAQTGASIMRRGWLARIRAQFQARSSTSPGNDVETGSQRLRMCLSHEHFFLFILAISVMMGIALFVRILWA